MAIQLQIRERLNDIPDPVAERVERGQAGRKIGTLAVAGSLEPEEAVAPPERTSSELDWFLHLARLAKASKVQ